MRPREVLTEMAMVLLRLKPFGEITKVGWPVLEATVTVTGDSGEAVEVGKVVIMDVALSLKMAM